MTTFVPLRQWSARTGALLKRLRREDTLVVTQNGRPAAYVIQADPSRVDREIDEIRRLRLGQATEAVRTFAAQAGSDKLTMKQISVEVAAHRRQKRRQRLS